jgi:hypothetical protein
MDSQSQSENEMIVEIQSQVTRNGGAETEIQRFKCLSRILAEFAKGSYNPS